MDISSVSDEQLALIAAGIVAALRKRFSVINGLWNVTLVTFFVSLAMCSVALMNKSAALPDAIALIHGLVRTIWVTIQSIAGVSMISYFASKINNGEKNEPIKADEKL